MEGCANAPSVTQRKARYATRASDVELEVDHVAVADDVVLALERELGVGAASGLRAELDQIFPPDDLGLDEAALEVGVDRARGLRRLAAALDRPGSALVLARGQEGDEVEQRVR